MDTVSLRRILLRTFIIFLCFAAVLAIAGVLGAGFGELQTKIVFTALSISAASMCGMAGTAYLQRNSGHPAGMAGIICCVAAAAMVVFGIWVGIKSSGYWKTAGSLITLSIASAHALGLLTVRLADDYRWAQRLAAVLTAILTLFVLNAVWGDTGDGPSWRLWTVIGIILALLTVLIPLLARLKPVAPEPLAFNPSESETLTLYRMTDDLYRDTAGIYYKVHRLKTAGN
jgi:hypothetical protein